MNSKEIQMLQDFLTQLTLAKGIYKDPQADAMIAGAVSQQPDAAYLLVQRALLMEQALTTAKSQIAALQSQIQVLQANAAPEPARGFFDANAWGNTAAPAARSAPVMPMPTGAAPYQSAPYQPSQYQAPPLAAPGFFGAGLGSTLGTVAATAAGVAGGAFLFQGIEHLMNPGNGGGFMRQGGTGAPVENIENTTVNNYYGADADKNNDRQRDESRADNSATNSDYDSNDYADNSDSGGYDDSMA